MSISIIAKDDLPGETAVTLLGLHKYPLSQHFSEKFSRAKSSDNSHGSTGFFTSCMIGFGIFY